MKEKIIEDGDEPGIPTKVVEEIFTDDSKEPTVLQEAFSNSQRYSINQPTPPKHVKTRPGRGGMNFSYVSTGYVVSILNRVFGHYWDWEILDQQIGKSQIWVKGKLTINSFKDTDRKIIKTAYGGAAIKMSSTGEPIDIADDLKAASSDALKKASSLVGIAADIYFPDIDGSDE